MGAGDKPQQFWEIFERGTHVREFTVTEGDVTELRLTIPPAGLVAFHRRANQAPENGIWPGLKIRTERDLTDVPLYTLDAGISRRHLAVASPRLVTREPFPPGLRAFTIEVPGYHPARCEVEVMADQMLTVEVELFPH